MSETPVASPSSPSVRFTAFDHAVMRKFDQTMNRISPSVAPANDRSIPVSRMKEICVDAGVRKFWFGNCSAATEKVIPTSPWPTIFHRADSPRLRWREDRKSTRLNSSHANISYAVFCLKKKKTEIQSLPHFY